MEVAMAMAVKVLLSLCCVGACGLAVYLYHILWLVPQKVLAKFEDQKIGGPRPSFPYGNLADMREAGAAAKAARASARRSGSGGGGIVHDYRPAVLPYYEKWRKEYGAYVSSPFYAFIHTAFVGVCLGTHVLRLSPCLAGLKCAMMLALLSRSARLPLFVDNLKMFHRSSSQLDEPINH